MVSIRDVRSLILFERLTKRFREKHDLEPQSFFLQRRTRLAQRLLQVYHFSLASYDSMSRVGLVIFYALELIILI